MSITNKINNRELGLYAYNVYVKGLIYNDIVYKDNNWTIALILTRDMVDITVSVQYENGGSATDKIVAEHKLAAQNGNKKYFKLDIRSQYGYLNLTVDILSKLRKLINIVDRESKKYMRMGIIQKSC